VSLEHHVASEPWPAQIRYVRHDGGGLQQMRQLLSMGLEDLIWSNGLGWVVEEVQALTHTGTHVHAPYHYSPTSAGKPARTIDQVPQAWCFAPGEWNGRWRTERVPAAVLPKANGTAKGEAPL
jgi:hypothetical protein